MNINKATHIYLLSVIAPILILILSSSKNYDEKDFRNIISECRKASSENVDEGILSYTRLLNIVNEGSDDPIACVGLNEGGNMCSDRGLYTEALVFYTLGIKQAKKYKNDSIYIACTNNVGNIYALFGDYEKAVWYFNNAYQLAVKHKNRHMMGVSIVNLVQGYCKLGDVENARKYFHLQRITPLKSKIVTQFRLLFNEGQLALAQEDLRSAFYYQTKAAETAANHNMSIDNIANAYMEVGKIYSRMNLPDSAITVCKRVIQMANECQYSDILPHAYRELYELYQKNGIPDSAMLYKSRYTEINDSIFNRQQFNLAKDKLFEYENQINNDHIQSLRNTITQLIVILCLIVVILCIAYYYNRKLRFVRERLIQQNNELIRQQELSNRLRTSMMESIAPEANDCLKDCEPDNTIRNHEIDDNETNSSTLPKEKMELLLQQIVQIMENVEVYTNPNFNLNELAKMVNSNTSYVSMVINSGYNKNFKTYLNELRIREATKRLTNDEKYENLTIAAVASSVGFNSVNSFNIAFKKYMGMTPSVFKKLSSNKVSNY